MRVRTLRLVQPPGVRSTGGLHVPVEADGTKTDDEFDFVSDAKKYHGKYKPKQAYLSLVSDIKAIIDQAREGTLVYDEDSNWVGTAGNAKGAQEMDIYAAFGLDPNDPYVQASGRMAHDRFMIASLLKKCEKRTVSAKLKRLGGWEQTKPPYRE